MAIRVSSELRRNLFEIRRLHTELRRDTELALSELAAAVERFNRAEISAEEAGFWCKAAVRSFVAEVDGLGFAMRRAVLRSVSQHGIALSIRERARLSEKGYDATADRIVEEKEALLSPEKGIKEAFKYFPRLFGSDHKLATSGEDWRGFKRVVDVRNRLMHPKIPEHLSAVNAYPALLPTVIWFYGQLAGLFADIISRTGGTLPPSPTLAQRMPPFSDRAAIWHEFFSKDEQLIKESGSKTLEYVQLLFRLLAQDTIRALDLCKESFGSLKEFKSLHGQFAFRLCLRTLFSEVQGYISAAVFHLKAGEVRGTIQLAPGDVASLEEGALEERLATAVTLWERELGNDRLIPRSGPLWEALRTARVLRDKITHPKKVDDLDISPNHTTTILSAHEYLNDIGFLIPTEAKWKLKGGSVKQAIQDAQSAFDKNAETEPQQDAEDTA